MSEFKGTKGKWIANLEYMQDNTIVEINAGDSKTEDWAVFTLYNAKDRSTQLSNAKLIACAPEMLEMIILLTDEFNMAKSSLRTARNECVKRFGERLCNNEISQEDYNLFVNQCNLETNEDYEVLEKAKQLIKKATEI